MSKWNRVRNACAVSQFSPPLVLSVVITSTRTKMLHCYRNAIGRGSDIQRQRHRRRCQRILQPGTWPRRRPRRHPTTAVPEPAWKRNRRRPRLLPSTVAISIES